MPETGQFLGDLVQSQLFFTFLACILEMRQVLLKYDKLNSIGRDI